MDVTTTDTAAFWTACIEANDILDCLNELDLEFGADDNGGPVLLDADGRPVETWRERYPCHERIRRPDYERITRRLRRSSCSMLQSWIKQTGRRLVIVSEGRDAAGKGGTIRRDMEHLKPRGAHVVALEKPTEAQATRWYFERYLEWLPSAGEIVLFNRSWYDRAGVEQVTGSAPTATTSCCCGRPRS